MNVLALDDAVVLELVGAFERDPDKALKAAIDAALDAHTPVIVDLTRVTRLPALALGVLVYADTKAARRGVAIAFVLPPRTRRVVSDVAGLEEHVRVYRSRAHALRAVTGSE